MPLQASPAGLLGRFASFGFVLRARILGRFTPSGFMLCTRILSRFAPSGFMLRTLILNRFAPSGFGFRALHPQSLRSFELRALRWHVIHAKIFEKISVSQLAQNALKRIEMQKKKLYPSDSKRVFCYARSLSGEAQPYLPHVTPRVPRSVHAKFHANWTKTVGARGIQTDKQTELL